MLRQTAISKVDLHQKLKTGEIVLGGNLKLKIYGALSCTSGKRMKIENRVFFRSKADATQFGFRPCGHCMQKDYLIWKSQQELG